MEPFTVTCSTCDSRIRVRNPSLVGQLATCPKCSSMIMIAPPAENGAQQAVGRLRVGQDRVEVAGPNGLPVDSMAVTKEGLSAHMGNLLDSPRLPDSESSSTHGVDDEYRLADIDHEAGAPAAPPTQHPTSPTQAWQPKSEPHIPSSQWTSESTNRTRQYLLVGFLGVSGIALAAVLFLGFLRWYTPDNSKQTLAVQPQQPDQVAPGGSASQGSMEDIRGDGAESKLHGPPEPSQVPTADSSLNAPASAANSPGEPSPALLDSELAPGPSTSASTASESPTPETGVASQSPANDSGPGTPTATDLQLPKQLAAFAPMLSFEIQPQLPDSIEILSEAPVTAEDLGLTSSAGLPSIPAIDLTMQSQITISGLVVPALPISQFVSLWSNLSGVPTVVDLDSLDAAAIDRNQTLALELVQSATVGSIMPQLGQALGLQLEPQENRYLRLRAPTELIEQKLPSMISLEGLIVDEAGEKWLTQALDELLPDPSVAWTIADRQLQRPVLADGSPLDPLVWFSSLKLIEGWRLATGQASTLSGYAPTQLSSVFNAPTEVTGLDTVLIQITPQSRPVSQVLPRICREAGVHAWIDWANLGAVGLGPQTTAVFVTSARPLRRVLADYASEFSLIVAVLDTQSLFITSNQAYRTTPQLYVIPSDGRTPDEWKSQLRPFTPAATGGVGVGSVVVIPTPDEKYILVRCCRPVVSF